MADASGVTAQTQTSDTQTSQTQQTQTQAHTQTQSQQQTSQQQTQQTQADATKTQADTSKAADWRAAITDEAAKKFAETSTDINHLVGRALTMQQKLSNAIVKPGKDAKPEDVAAYRKAMDIPDDPKGYEFTKPEHLSEEEFKSAGVQATLGAIAKIAHDNGVPKTALGALWGAYSQMEAAALKAQVDADKEYANQSEAALRKEWGAEYDVNKTFADRAAAHLFGNKLADVKQIETKDGRFVLDHPDLVRALGKIGREMGEGTLGPVLTDGDVAAIDQQITASRAKQMELQAQGKNADANKEYQNEMALIAKKAGNKPVVGAAGRTH